MLTVWALSVHSNWQCPTTCANHANPPLQTNTPYPPYSPMTNSSSSHHNPISLKTVHISNSSTFTTNVLNLPNLNKSCMYVTWIINWHISWLLIMSYPKRNGNSSIKNSSHTFLGRKSKNSIRKITLFLIISCPYLNNNTIKKKTIISNSHTLKIWKTHYHFSIHQTNIIHINILLNPYNQFNINNLYQNVI